jgi:hypothetical protein
MDKWRKLREWDELPHQVARYMDELEIEQHRLEPLKKREEGFLYNGIAKFDQKAWEEILEKHGLQGLS